MWRVILAALCFGLVSTCVGLQVHSIEVGAHSSESEALVLERELKANIAPVYVQRCPESGGPEWRVRVGYFGCMAEAHATKMLCDNPAVSAGKVVSFTWDGRELLVNQLPVRLPLMPEQVRQIPADTDCRMDYEVPQATPADAEAALKKSDVSVLTDNELLLRGTYGDAEVAVSSLEFLVKRASSSASTNAARLMLARRLNRMGKYAEAGGVLDEAIKTGGVAEVSEARLIKCYLVYCSKTREEALEAFKQYANSTGILPEHRLDASIRVANLARALKRYPEAWFCYTQLEQAIAGEKIQAFLKMQKAAISFELVTAGKSTWEETRSLCEAAEAITNAPREDRATARLMRAETYVQQGTYDLALNEMQDLRSLYPGQKREAACARFWQAYCLEKLGRYDEAVAEYAALESEPASDRETFREFHPKAKGLARKSELLLRLGRVDEARAAQTELLTKYPGSKDAASLSGSAR